MREQKNLEKMGQIVRRKKKGRPAKPDPAGRRAGEAETTERDLRRSLRRRNVKYVFDLDDYFDDDEIFEETDEDQRRKEKKLKLLLKLQNDKDGCSESTPRFGVHSPTVSASSSDEDKPSKKRKIDARETGEDDDDENDDINDDDNYSGDDDEVRQTKMEPKTVHSHPGTPAQTLPRLPLPEKKTLELILDKLQKKDIYGVYAEPVDPEELPDYHDVIEHPMDFATVRNNLGNGAYETLEQFEKSSNLSPANAPQDSSPSPSSRCDSNAAAAAARAWMSVGAGGFRQAGESTNLHMNQISADSLYNPTHGLQPQVSRFRPEFSGAGMHFQPEKNAPLHAFVPQVPQPIRVGSEAQFPNQPIGFPQLVTADLSRFNLQSPWQNLSPQMHAKQKQESLPPDLNIGFQSPGSPGRHSSGVRVDSQQPDLALQL
ncbi:bromodomain-containing DDB_G0270170 [Olea europaea subsp. europaea]|uniref:Bromodomain-containing DDB_G0270170 n=1 Tax=Olea europaea subsp. europaea TaxID=158383 RepID=A0A8S0RC58_OLEEU|nr:bromodomain-containing DDB_G0270170 [Olea europaea subsp. europaea]